MSSLGVTVRIFPESLYLTEWPSQSWWCLPMWSMCVKRWERGRWALSLCELRHSLLSSFDTSGSWDFVLSKSFIVSFFSPLTPKTWELNRIPPAVLLALQTMKIKCWVSVLPIVSQSSSYEKLLLLSTASLLNCVCSITLSSTVSILLIQWFRYYRHSVSIY